MAVVPHRTVVASDVDLRDGSELVFWRSAIRAVAGSFQEFPWGGDVDCRLSLHWDYFRLNILNKFVVIKMRLMQIRESSPDPLSPHPSPPLTLLLYP